MSLFYSLSGSSSKKWAVAYASYDFDELDLWDLVDRLQYESEWTKLVLTVDSDKPLGDLPSCDVLGRICSPRLVEVLNPFLKKVLWLPVEINVRSKSHSFSFLHFIDSFDILNEKKTIRLASRVINPVISLSKIGDLKVASLRPTGKVLIVHKDVKNAIEQNGCQGVEFESIPSVE